MCMYTHTCVWHTYMSSEAHAIVSVVCGRPLSRQIQGHPYVGWISPQISRYSTARRSKSIMDGIFSEACLWKDHMLSEGSQTVDPERQIAFGFTYAWCLKEPHSQEQRADGGCQGSGVSKLRRCCSNVRSLRYKVSATWGCDVEPGDDTCWPCAVNVKPAKRVDLQHPYRTPHSPPKKITLRRWMD